jgi:hypothetical protein
LQRRGPGMGKHLQARPFILAKILSPKAYPAKSLPCACPMMRAKTICPSG